MDPGERSRLGVQDEGGPLQREAAGRQVAHELLKRMASMPDVAMAARASVRAVIAEAAADAAAAAPVFAVGCVVLAATGEVLGHVDESMVARNFQGHRIGDMVEVCIPVKRRRLVRARTVPLLISAADSLTVLAHVV